MLKKPLTTKSVLRAFSSLALSAEAVQVTSDGTEAAVYGEWSRAKLLQVFKQLGFASLDGGYAFVNDRSTVGIVLQGTSIDPSKNRFRTFGFEVQARTLLEARSKRSNSSLRLI